MAATENTSVEIGPDWGVAEMPLVPFAAAVAIAIYDATGVWLNQQPMTPERVLAALREDKS